MSGGEIGFIIWALCGGVFIVIGIRAFSAKKPIGFWANVKAPSMDEISDIRAYNRAMGKMWCIFGAIFILLGAPLLAGQNSPWIILSILGTMFSVIILMVICMRIERKYWKK